MKFGPGKFRGNMPRLLAKLDPADPLPARAAIRIRDLRKRFGQLTAIDGVSVEIAHGEFFMIVGPSGCGKTTLLRILAGLDSVTSGTIEIETPNSQRPMNSMIFQGDSIFPWMTVWDNAAYGLKMRRISRPVIKDVVGHYLARTGLTRFAKYYPHQLSGGMRQRVSIARAFANDPEILLMDEPFSALDAQNKLLLQEELLRILGGLDEVTSGEVEIADPASGRPKYSMVFQGDSIFPWMTVRENAAYGLKMRKAPAAVIGFVISLVLNEVERLVVRWKADA